MTTILLSVLVANTLDYASAKFVELIQCFRLCAELNKRNVLRVGFSPGASYSPLAVVTTDGPDEGGRLWHLVRFSMSNSFRYFFFFGQTIFQVSVLSFVTMNTL